MSIKYFLIMAVVYFIILYLVAFFSHRGYREDDDILWVSRSQWAAIFVIWLPILVLLTKLLPFRLFRHGYAE